MKKDYIPRLFDKTLSFALESKGAVLVVGPKWCGKSTTCALQAKTIIDLTIGKTKEQYISSAKLSPLKFLHQFEKPLMIDEWQEMSFIWNAIKVAVDQSGKFGQFILTGSVTDRTLGKYSESRHTGIGRIIKKMMRPMSLYESGDSNGEAPLTKIKEGKLETCFNDKKIEDYAYYICRGGWPLAIKQKREVALQQAIDFYNMLVNDDIFSLHDIPLRRNISLAKRLLRSYSRNISTQCADNTLIGDIVENDASFDVKTFKKYMSALERLYVVEELEAWNPNLRSKIAIREKNTRHFVDPSIAAAALNVSPEGLFKDVKTFGFLFESLAIRDLRIYCDAINASVYHYKDENDREADAVIQFKDGSWALVEVKLGDQEDIDIAAKKLIKLSKDINIEKTGKPAFLMIITKGMAAYKREDGVYEVPLACLKN